MGHPIEIVKTSPNHSSIVLDEESLIRILTQDDMEDRRLIIVSMSGYFDRSKDLMLNFFLRYMNSQYKLENRSKDWMSDEMQPLEGASWENYNTEIGIQLWSEAFKTELTNGEKVAILLMNTKGFFDCDSIMDHLSASALALTTTLSSMQLFFLPECMRKKFLQHLHFVIEYAKLPHENVNRILFQRLKFLIRDWPYPHEYKYGNEGGRDYLLQTFGNANIQDPELLCLKEKLESNFSEYSCFLMPHFVSNPAQDIKVNGLLSDLRNDYKQQIKNLVPMLLARENLDTKKIDLKYTAATLLEDFKKGVKFYQELDYILFKNSLNTKYNATATRQAVVEYENLMNTFCGPKKSYLKNKKFQSAHDICYKQAIQYFEKEKKLGYNDEADKIFKLLIDLKYKEFKSKNDDKNRFSVSGFIIFLIIAIMFITWRLVIPLLKLAKRNNWF
ncbi:atlastin-like [Trichogramma pretiosum]|uniref:atlastin-like n=1 Tax=Trichogramma pretiosum TaxID=7493 RepID=UPI000C71983A|nr:atlastin-like [Trichogramma pretiosum]